MEYPLVKKFEDLVNLNKLQFGIMPQKKQNSTYCALQRIKNMFISIVHPQKNFQQNSMKQRERAGLPAVMVKTMRKVGVPKMMVKTTKKI